MVNDDLVFLARMQSRNVFGNKWLQHIVDIEVTIDFGSWGDEAKLRLAAIADTRYKHDSLRMLLPPKFGPTFRGAFSSELIVKSPLPVYMSYIDPCLIQSDNMFPLTAINPF